MQTIRADQHFNHFQRHGNAEAQALTLRDGSQPFCSTGTVLHGPLRGGYQFALASGTIVHHQHAGDDSPVTPLPCAVMGRGASYAEAKAAFWREWRAWSQERFGGALYLVPRRFMYDRG